MEGLLRCIRINVVFISFPILGCQGIGSGRLVMLKMGCNNFQSKNVKDLQQFLKERKVIFSEH